MKWTAKTGSKHLVRTTVRCRCRIIFNRTKIKMTLTPMAMDKRNTTKLTRMASPSNPRVTSAMIKSIQNNKTISRTKSRMKRATLQALSTRKN